MIMYEIDPMNKENKNLAKSVKEHSLIYKILFLSKHSYLACLEYLI